MLACFCVFFEAATLVKTMIRARGGARHHSKPYIDVGLVYKALSANAELVKDLGPYEHISRNGGVDYKGLVQVLDLLKAFVRVEPSAEIHPQPLKQALLRLLADIPEINATKYNGNVWTQLRQERCTCMLYHLRSVARDKEKLKFAAGKLTAAQYANLKELVDMIELPEGQAESEANLDSQESGRAGTPMVEAPSPKTVTPSMSTPKVGAPSPKTALPKMSSRPKAPAARSFKPDEPGDQDTVFYDEDAFEEGAGQDLPQSPKGRKLKPQGSLLSVDSDGFPNMLASPSPVQESLGAQPSFLRRKPGFIAVAKSSEEVAWTSSSEVRVRMGFEVQPKAKPGARAKEGAAAKATDGHTAKATSESKAMPKAKGKAKADVSTTHAGMKAKVTEYDVARANYEGGAKAWLASEECQALIKSMPLPEVKRRRFESRREDAFVFNPDSGKFDYQ